MKRRDFIRSASAAAFLPALSRAIPNASPVPVIDTHTHFYDPTRPKGVPWPKPTETFLYAPFLPERFRTATAGLNVVGTVVVEASAWVEDNQWLLDLAENTPEIVGIVGRLKLGQPEFAAQLRQYSANRLFRGLRVNLETVKDVGTTAIDADLTRLTDAGLSLDVIGNGTVIGATERVARTWPALRIVVNHLPFPEWDGKVPEMRAALKTLAGFENVYVKISDVVRRREGKAIEEAGFYRPALDALFELFGPDRVVHATNWPVSARVAPYETVQRVVADYFATKSRAEQERYFWRNSYRAYRWIPRGTSAHLAP